MPSTSKKQRNFMAAAAHNPAFAKKVGISQKVAKEFNAADKGKKFGTGGDVGYTYGGNNQINKQRTRFGSKFGYKLNAPDENLNKYIGKKEGGKVATKKEDHAEKGEMKKDLSQDKKMIKKAFAMHDKQEHKGEHTNLSKLAKGGSTATKLDPRVSRMLASRTAGAQDPTKARTAAPMFSKGGSMSRITSKGEHPVQKQSKRGAEMVKMAKGGLAGGHKSADGCATKGKTKGKTVAMCGGGMAKGKK